ncbi:MAG: Fur family transcriptional regulator [Sulfurimonadaceae bacterium]|jgi:Fur family ferric uptake transcriptional regulator
MKIEKLIEEKNLKLTSARRELLEIFFHSLKPLSFEDVRSRIKMDKATFYRNVSKFEDQAILSSFESNDKKRYYELSTLKHAHFICKICNNIECVKESFSLTLEGYEIEDIILKGICKQCNK